MTDQIADAALALVHLDLAPLLSGPTRKQAHRALLALTAGTVYRDWAGDVRCESDSSGTVYLVTYDECSCPARVRCWHRIAYEALCRWEHHVRRMSAEEIEAPLF